MIRRAKIWIFYNAGQATGTPELRVDFPPQMTGEEALQASIDKWEILTLYYEKGMMPDVDPTATCALCNLYINNEKACDGCPVFKATGKTYCDNTPFVRWSTLVIAANPRTSLAKVAKKELEFLKSLQASAAEPTEESGGLDRTPQVT